MASPVDEILVVLGHRRAEIAPTLAGLPAQVVANPDYARGMLSSLRAGLAASSSEAEWSAICLGDQPALQPETVAALRAEAERGGPGLVIPSFQRRRGHPVWIHRQYRQEIEALPDEGGLRELFRRHPEDIRYVEATTPTVLTDMDTPEDYQRELAARERGAE